MKDNRSVPRVWFVIPCYNETEALALSTGVFVGELRSLIDAGKVAPESSVCFVNDGSSDGTWELINELAAENPLVRGITLSRNRGHQHALFAGLMEAYEQGVDVTISMDADGQDDVHAATAMLDEYTKGADVVYGVRSSREKDTFFKRFTAESYYKVLGHMGAEVVFNHADYRLMSSDALAGLAEFSERNLFLRGMVPLVGFKSAQVEYERAERVAGESHYPLRKMLALAFDGITSFSVKPLQYVTTLGMLFSLLGFVGVAWALIAFFTGHAVAGWASTIAVLSIIGGIQMLALGVIGTYIGKIYIETKRRPRFIISERTWE
ncbi:glycosyltransferase involved in cell wall biosynthesis [Arcanobacterium wilhelmae]|uniref:Glycosyltransferase involved in cell wall biosynthesis n=1 Tax=Arcanobacterium wilhelmae TaxID=1803177 RepID=A0ABT9N8I2_9ACTO|nr:glycosyltransferase family 2 protein [Arcanobacterium wilhelmae]MDP9800008.1 glycosyltransferase involved in cell wall biosynthesis [Arcanobacterium wilhelmae]WFN89506.1 glycosyltransferase family 2 protein [Arcanobacterium wilhelmae]